MKKIILILTILLLATGCNILNSKDNSDAKEEPYTLTSDQDKIANRIVNLLDPQFENKEFNDLTDYYKVELLYYIAEAENEDVNGYPLFDNPELYLNKKNFEMLTRRYFGPEAKIDMVDIYCPFCDKVYYYYNEQSESYMESTEHLGHGASFPIIKRKQMGVFKKGNMISIKYKTLFSNYVDIGSLEKFYKSINDAIWDKNAVASFSDYCWGDDFDFNCDYDKMFNEIDFDIFSYNFRLDGDNFYFINYTIE